ncbi:DUF1761 domain-containing protein [Oricola cellulosilytica]|uniref:DUF1761 domain-containing protein n=1 Tax=Oricola cellulosilytica TaxID=1429082 RepID=A0A4R0PE81_9HYPH|nr:DUF1761 domain-containing protein [Oricola cellulosilytica]TCD15891.1 DUF1761 domain-containing protein [Oricola cellulosilytica]
MDFGGINYLAVLVAAVAAFAAGAGYYGALGKSWMKAARIDPAEAKMSPALFVTSFVAELVMAWVLAGVIGHLGEGQATIRNGVISGGFVWLGFIAATMTVNHRYQGFGWKLTIIDGAHWLIVAVLMGGIIGAFGA